MSPSLIDRLDPRDFESVAKLVLPTPIYEWIRSGSDDEQSLKDNVSAFRRYRLNPHVLVDVSNIDLATTVQGVPLQFPVLVAPIGVQRAAHPDGELGTAAGVTATGALFVEAVNATTSMEDVRARHPELPFWLQLYNWNDRDALAALIARAEEAGASGIVPLVNTAIGVNHTPPRVGYRLPAGVSFAHFTTSPDLEAGNTWNTSSGWPDARRSRSSPRASSAATMRRGPWTRVRRGSWFERWRSPAVARDLGG